MISVRTRRNVR